jgi:hypothetical protein
MQATGDKHCQIRELVFGIAQHVFDNTRALDTRNRMFHSDANL